MICFIVHALRAIWGPLRFQVTGADALRAIWGPLRFQATGADALRAKATVHTSGPKDIQGHQPAASAWHRPIPRSGLTSVGGCHQAPYRVAVKLL